MQYWQQVDADYIERRQLFALHLRSQLNNDKLLTRRDLQFYFFYFIIFPISTPRVAKGVFLWNLTGGCILSHSGLFIIATAISMSAGGHPLKAKGYNANLRLRKMRFEQVSGSCSFIRLSSRTGCVQIITNTEGDTSFAVVMYLPHDS